MAPKRWTVPAERWKVPIAPTMRVTDALRSIKFHGELK
jgi:hypothetical protein